MFTDTYSQTRFVDTNQTPEPIYSPTRLVRHGEKRRRRIRRTLFAGLIGTTAVLGVNHFSGSGHEEEPSGPAATVEAAMAVDVHEPAPPPSINHAKCMSPTPQHVAVAQRLTGEVFEYDYMPGNYSHDPKAKGFVVQAIIAVDKSMSFEVHQKGVQFNASPVPFSSKIVDMYVEFKDTPPSQQAAAELTTDAQQGSYPALEKLAPTCKSVVNKQINFDSPDPVRNEIFTD